MTEPKSKQQALESLEDMKRLFLKIKMHGKLYTGFQRCLKEIEAKDPLIVIMASDCAELSFRRVVLDVCQKHDVFVSSRHAKQVMAELLGCKDREAQICVVTDFGPKWSVIDKKEFERFFVR